MEFDSFKVCFIIFSEFKQKRKIMIELDMQDRM